MDADFGMDISPQGDEATERAERVARMRSLQALHRRLVANKLRERERLNLFEAKLEEVVAELDPFDSKTGMIRLLYKIVWNRLVQYETLDDRLDVLTDSFISGAIILAEHVRVEEASGE